jgi:four helix bundle protein
MAYKFERLEVWGLALEYTDMIYAIAGRLPRSEEYNLKSQVVRAATSVALNIAEGLPAKATRSRRASWVWPFVPWWRR